MGRSADLEGHAGGGRSPAPAGRSQQGAPAHARAALLGAALTLASAGAALALVDELLQGWPGAGTVGAGQALLTVCLGGGALLLGWVCAVLAVATLDTLRAGGRSLGSPTPHPDRLPRAVRWTSAVLVSVTTLTVGPVAAHEPTTTVGAATLGARASWDLGTDAGAPTPTQVAQPAQLALRPADGGVPEPGWTPAPGPTTPTPTGTVGLVSSVPHEQLARHVVVRRGDTLWDIAARHLGPQATTQDVAEAWPRWYAANRDLIGTDPDLILPGQELTVPGTAVDR